MPLPLDDPRIRMVSVIIDPPPQIEYARWPCCGCGEFRDLPHMRAVELASLSDRSGTRRLLACLDCIRDLARHPTLTEPVGDHDEIGTAPTA